MDYKQHLKSHVVTFQGYHTSSSLISWSQWSTALVLPSSVVHVQYEVTRYTGGPGSMSSWPRRVTWPQATASLILSSVRQSRGGGRALSPSSVNWGFSPAAETNTRQRLSVWLGSFYPWGWVDWQSHTWLLWQFWLSVSSAQDSRQFALHDK